MQARNDWNNWILEEYNWENYNLIICDNSSEPTQEQIDFLINWEIKIKKQNSIAINNIASLCDQLNLLMEVNYAIVSFISQTSPEILEVPAIQNWLALREDINLILNT